MPDVAPIVAVAVLLLVQVPPVYVSVNVIDEPEHTEVGPVIAEGDWFTVIIVDIAQPPGAI